jgi:hypothetical protein
MAMFDNIKDTVTDTVDIVANTVKSAANNAWGSDQDESSVAQAPKANTEYGNFE